MNTFTKENLGDLRKTMLKEMEEVAKKYGVVAKFGNIRFNSHEFRVKMEVRQLNAPTFAAAPAVKPVTGQRALVVGSMIAHPARRSLMKVIGIDGKHCRIQTNRGTVYRIKVSEAEQYTI